jgi:Uma2 family endonuclease
MSMPALESRHWTLEEVEALIDERDGHLAPRYELVDGELLVTPGPNGRHQRITLHLVRALDAYILRHRLGELRFGPGEVRITSDSYLEPDLFVIPAVNGRMPRAMDRVHNLLLAIEVLSPSSARHDRFTKRRFYLDHGVPEYWIVDGDAQAFEIWKPGDERATLLDQHLTWNPVGAIQPFALDLRQFFASVADEPDR